MLRTINSRKTHFERNLYEYSSTFRLPRQYTGNDLRKCLERLILLDFSAVRQRGKVEFRPFEMCKK